MKRIEIVVEYIKIVQKNLDALTDIKSSLIYTFPIDNYENLSFDEKVKIDALVHRVSKLQDTLGKLIKFYLEFEGIETSSLTPRDIYNIAQKYNLIDSVDDWFEIRDLRNSIAQDYSLMVNQLTDIVNKIYDLSEKLINMSKNAVFIIKNKIGESYG